VDGSSGLLYVVSAEALAGQSAMVEVRATDPGGLYVTTMVKVGLCVSSSGTGVVQPSIPPFHLQFHWLGERKNAQCLKGD
jgi:hypothetical protein